MERRLPGLDAMRGLAIVMIIFANIEAMVHGVNSIMMDASQLRGYSPAVDSVLSAVVNGKWRSLLMIIFGVGIAMQQASVGVHQTRWLTRRYAWLVVFGILHFVLLWMGDILTAYGVLGLLSLTMVGIPAARLANGMKYIAIGAAAFGLLLAGVFALMSTDSETMSSFFTPMIVAERAAAQGSYWQGLGYRVTQLPMALMNSAMMIGFVVPAMMFGLWMHRSGLLVETPHAKAVRTELMRVLLPIGLALNLPALFFFNSPSGPPMFYQMAIEFVFAPILSAGIFCFVMNLALGGVRMPRVLESLGRMAMTCYVLQSILGLILVSSWGLGWFGRLGGLASLGAAFAIALISAAITLIIGRFSKIGPVEYLWRTVSRTMSKPAVLAPPPVSTGFKI